MGAKGNQLKITLTLSQAARLATHLSHQIGKGSISTTPGWMRRIISKISEAARDQYPDEYAKPTPEGSEK